MMPRHVIKVFGTADGGFTADGDGRPNKPMTALTVEVQPCPSPLARPRWRQRRNPP